MDFAVPADHRVELKESEKIDYYLDLGKKKITKQKETTEHESENDAICNWCVWFSRQKISYR